MENKSKNIKRITRNHRGQTPLNKIHSVEDLLTSDDINDILRDLDKNKPEITDLIIVWRDKKDGIWYDLTPKTLLSQTIFMLESTKHDILNNSADEE